MLRPGRGSDNLPTTGDYSGSPGYGGGGGTYGNSSSGYGGSNGSNSGGHYGGYNAGSPYGGYAANTNYSFDADEYKEKPRKRKNNVSDTVVRALKEPLTWTILVALFFFILYIRATASAGKFLKEMDFRNLQHAKHTYRSIQEERDSLKSEVRSNREAYRKSIEESNSLQKENRKLQKLIDELKIKYESPEKQVEKLRMSTREQAWKQQVQLLQQATSRESRRAATEKFGPGPHFVAITIVLPHLHPQMATQTFTIQMAPLDSMPHAVHLFLEQVAHKLWDNAWFYINGPHVFQAGPQADEEELEAAIAAGADERSIALRPFRELQLDTLSFPEYSEDYPHLPWTLGFTGRPGGPDFYINKMDNTKAHGPGGQFQHELEEFADSCFAKIIDGMSTVFELANAPTVMDEGDDFRYYFKEPVHIIRMRIVEDPRKRKNEQAQRPEKDAFESEESGFDDNDAHEEGEGVIYEDTGSEKTKTSASLSGDDKTESSVKELLQRLAEMNKIPAEDVVKGAATQEADGASDTTAHEDKQSVAGDSTVRKRRKAQMRRKSDFDHMVEP